MRKHTAIKLLRSQQESLKTTYGDTFAAWKNHTISLVKDFFGESSPEYSAAILLAYLRIVDREIDYSTATVHNKTEKNTVLNTAFLENCIHKIESFGLYKKPKSNFLQRLSDTALWTLISLLVPAIFSLGYWFGNHDLPKKDIPPTAVSPLPKAKTVSDSLNKK